ncbi:MAG: Asp-tRNA(Asn)/Glu-tRNA(Gln) amidotransferase subunit GatB, partial [Candidatus Pacebacteria bacterium]|nr:Asp-tRNA(Asn)/Glu-tRNA(Gln) amidotransferase subunit GatB [Candidatus Paceibacterota bacterium]
IDYEIKRQTNILKKSGKIVQETRGWNDIKGITISQREKEQAHDYRYFPEPDLPIIKIKKTKTNRDRQIKTEINLQKIKSEIPELPLEKRERFIKEYQIPEKDVDILVKNKELADYFEGVVEEIQLWINDERIPADYKFFLLKIGVNYLITDLLGLMEKEKLSFQDIKMTPENFAEMVIMLYKGEISSRVAKDTLVKMVKTGVDPSHIIDEGGLKQISDEKEIETIVSKIIKENQKAVDDYKKGKENSIQFLIGQVMRETKGKINPEQAKKIIKKYL